MYVAIAIIAAIGLAYFFLKPSVVYRWAFHEAGIFERTYTGNKDVELRKLSIPPQVVIVWHYDSLTGVWDSFYPITKGGNLQILVVGETYHVSVMGECVWWI